MSSVYDFKAIAANLRDRQHTPRCEDHLDYIEENCAKCGEFIDKYGNTESNFRYCCAPDCGCMPPYCMSKEPRP